MEYPLISCIVLTYNKFTYLYETLDSILSQDYPNIEIIIGDDGSKEFPKENIEEYVSKHKKFNLVNLTIYNNISNMGTVKNANMALEKSNGKYLINVSCGDVLFEENTLSKIVGRFEQTGHSLIAFRSLLCEEKNLQPIRYIPSNAVLSKISALNTPEKQYFAFAQCYYYEMASGCCTYQTKENLIESGCWDESYKLLEDAPFYIKYTRNGKFINTAYDIVAIKYRAGGISKSPKVPTGIKTQMDIDIKHYYNKEVKPYLGQFGFFERRKINYSKICAFNPEHRWVSVIKRLKYFDLLLIHYIDIKRMLKEM